MGPGGGPSAGAPLHPGVRLEAGGELAYLHKSRLQTYRERLAQAWPPESSDAAKAYLAKLDELILAVEDVARVSTQNHQYSRDIPAAFSEAERKLQPIREEYDRIDRALRNGQPTPLPSGQTPEKFLEGKLNEARGVMRGLSADLSLVRVGMAPPRPYLPPVKHQSGDERDYGGVVPPVIPPVLPYGGAVAPTPTVTGATLAPVPVATGPNLTGLTPTPTAPRPRRRSPARPGRSPRRHAAVHHRPGDRRSAADAARHGQAHHRHPGHRQPRSEPRRAARDACGRGHRRRSRWRHGCSPRRRGSPRQPGRRHDRRTGRRHGRPRRGGHGQRTRHERLRRAHGRCARAGRRRDEDDPDFDPDTLWAVDQGGAPVLDAPDAPGPVDPGPAIGLAR
ncbi:hypothetical protein ACFQZ4_28555 [Catellatospora coxensis]